MKKIRINELARELEVKPNKILELLVQFGVAEKKTHSSSIDEDVANKLRRFYGFEVPAEEVAAVPEAPAVEPAGAAEPAVAAAPSAQAEMAAATQAPAPAAVPGSIIETAAAPQPPAATPAEKPLFRPSPHPIRPPLASGLGLREPAGPAPPHQRRRRLRRPSRRIPGRRSPDSLPRAP